MTKLLLAASALALATAAGAQTPPVSSTTDSMIQPATGETMPPTSSPMNPSIVDQSITPDRTADPVDDPTTREGALPATSAVPRPPVARPPVARPPLARPRPMAPNPQPGARPQPAPGMSAARPAVATPSAGRGDYPVCSATVTDSCVNPSDIRRGIAQRPTRR